MENYAQVAQDSLRSEFNESLHNGRKTGKPIKMGSRSKKLREARMAGNQEVPGQYQTPPKPSVKPKHQVAQKMKFKKKIRHRIARRME